MKKTIFIVFTALLCGLALGTSSYAADWSKPIPVGSTENQVTPGALPTKADATSIKSFYHPATSGALNYGGTTIMVDGADFPVAVDDFVGVSGLLPATVNTTPTFEGMLDKMIVETFTDWVGCTPASCLAALDPAHGFCPEPQRIIVGGNEYSFIFECDALRSPDYRGNYFNKTDRQVEVFDVRNAQPVPPGFTTIIGAPPLEMGATGFEPPVGDAREIDSPYTSLTYPATIASTWTVDTTLPSGFAWRWGPAILDMPYEHNYTHGMAEIDGGLVTAIYDPVKVEKFAQVQGVALPSNERRGTMVIDHTYGKFYEKYLLNHAGLAFYRPDSTSGRMLLSGYSSWQLGRLNFSLSGLDLVHNVLDWLWKLVIGLNMNPIDVVNLGNDYLAVVNQATLGDVDGPFYNLSGIPVTTPSGTVIKWRDILSTDSTPAPLKDSGTPGQVYFPHSIPAYAVIWEKYRDWTANENPNKIFDPYISRGSEQVPGFALVGANMFDADVITDSVGGTVKKSLIVASGDIDKTNTSYYIYKISPDSEKLYLDLTYVAPSAIFKQAIGLAGEPYKVEPPAPGYVPFQIKGMNANGDKCGDIVMTWRGAETVWQIPPVAPRWFYNHEGDQVRFKKSGGYEMFSEYFTIYYGKEAAGKCIFSDPGAAVHIPLKASTVEPKWQVAAVATGDLNGDARDDIVVGNLNPMKIEGETNCTAYAGIFYAALDGSFSTLPDEFVRLGFAKTATCPDPLDTGKYLIDVWGAAGGGLAGVGGLEIDSYGNAGGIIGLPVMLPSMGCPKFVSDASDTFVTSPIELGFALLYNQRNPGVSWGPSDDIVPMRCVGSGPTPTPTITSVPPGPLEWSPGGDITAYTPPAEAHPLEDCAAQLARAFPGDPTPPPCCQPAADCDNCCPVCDTPAEQADYYIMCERYRLSPCCDPTTGPYRDSDCCRDLTSALDRSSDEFFAEGGGGDGGSAYARCDHVYDSKAPYIATADDLKPAAAQVGESAASANVQPTKPLSENAVANIQNLLLSLGISEKEAVGVTDKLQKAFSDRFLYSIAMPFFDIMDQLYVPQDNQQASLNDTNKTAGWFAPVREAMANILADSPGGFPMLRDLTTTPPTYKNSRFRLPRFHVPPGQREIDVVVNKEYTPPPDTCGDLAFDPAIEECDWSVTPDGCSSGFTCDHSCHCRTDGSPFCGNGFADPGEVCGEPTLPACPTGETCVDCHCQPEVPTEGGGPDEDGGCPPCCPPCDTCSVAAEKSVKIECIGGSSPAAIEALKNMNGTAKEILGITNDIFCESEAMMRVTVNIPDAAAPSLTPGDLLSRSINPDLGAGNIAPAALIQDRGTKPIDFTQTVMLPVRTDEITAPTILLPLSSSISTSFGKGTYMTPDLSEAATIEPTLNLSGATPISADLVSFYDQIAPSNEMILNRVINWKITSSNITGRAVTDLGAASHIIENRIEPMLCSVAASCPDSEAISDPAKQFPLDFGQVVSIMRANADKCRNNVCSPELFEAIGWPKYQIYRYALVQGKVAKSSETTVPFPDITEITYAGGPPMEFARGGCKCDMTASAPHAASLIAMILMSSSATAGYVFWRRRGKKRR